MSGLNWFSGGNERQQQASLLIKDLVADLKQSGGKEPLQKVLLSFDEELKRGESFIPFILSRMTVAVSTVLKEHRITLQRKNLLNWKTCMPYCKFDMVINGPFSDR
ncbi:bacteriocin immunity protein [Streptococcus dysgalactiae]|uniref:bacteriocin immunity protein n=1 Tax=Streptococcus dysgalactiae TaxID=1334 RepID=UPI002D792420|nr:bacteriocin immunity protein [Streptococcus dysgalactiae]